MKPLESRLVKMMIISDPTTWSITYDYHSDNFRGVIYDCNMFRIHATGYNQLGQYCK